MTSEFRRRCSSFVWRAGAIVFAWALAACTVSGLIWVPEPNALLFLTNLLATCIVVTVACMTTVLLLRRRSTSNR
jgi:hypothetical protein